MNDPLDSNKADLAAFLAQIFPENFPWRKDEKLLRARYEARRRRQMEANLSMGRLVTKWGKFPKKSLSVITCPFPKCDHHCIHRGAKSLAKLFDSHIQGAHSIKPTKACLDLIESKAREYHSFKFHHYQDPFLYVPLEAVTK
jgi:hypothetical protein